MFARNTLSGVVRRLQNYSSVRKLTPSMRKILSVEGHLNVAEASLLFDLASKVKDGCIVEVGSYRGRSTSALALGSHAGGSNVPVYAIDPHDTFTGVLGGKYGPWDRGELFNNLLRLHCVEMVRVIGLRSEIISPGWVEPIGLLWLDGDHTYEGVKSDFECWEKFVLDSGLIVFHDSIDKAGGPARVIDGLLNTPVYNKVCVVDQTTVLQKRSAARVVGESYA